MRSKMGWDLPPGVSVRDIPGNRPEDEAAETLAEKVFDVLEKAGLTGKTSGEQDGIDSAVEQLCQIIGEADTTGRSSALSDFSAAQEYRDEQILAAITPENVRLGHTWLRRKINSILRGESHEEAE